MCVSIEESCHSYQDLQENILTLKERHHEDIQVRDGAMDPKPLYDMIWGAPIPENFKPPSLVKFDGKRDP